jgi:Flp pilus assembly protein TadG
VVWSRVVPSPVACRTLRDSPPRQRSAREFVSDLTGATAVEFALIVPVLLFLVLGTLELGLIIYTNSAAGFATRDVARRIATNRLTASGATDAVKQSLPGWVQGHTSVTVSQSTPSNIFTNQITVSASFPTAKSTPTNFLSIIYGSQTMEVRSTMQQEPAL